MERSRSVKVMMDRKKLAAGAAEARKTREAAGAGVVTDETEELFGTEL